MDAVLQDARKEIASEIGPDVGSFTPPDEKRFTGVEIMIGIGGVMLYSFFKGMAGKIAEKAGEKVGEKIWDSVSDYMSEKFDALMGNGKKEQEQALEGAYTEVQHQISATGLTKEQVSALAQELEPMMVQALSKTAPEEISLRIAHTVRTVAVKTL